MNTTVPSTETEVNDRPERFLQLSTDTFVEVDPNTSSAHRRLNDGLLLVLCILGTVLFFPLGLFAVYNLVRARKHFREGKIPAARARAFCAQILSLIAVLLGMVWLGLVIGLTIQSFPPESKENDNFPKIKNIDCLHDVTPILDIAVFKKLNIPNVFNMQSV